MLTVNGIGYWKVMNMPKKEPKHFIKRVYFDTGYRREKWIDTGKFKCDLN